MTYGRSPMMYAVHLMKDKTYEPIQRKFNGSQRPVWVCHRFPIKGGISLHDIMRIAALRNHNKLLDLVHHNV